MNLTKSGNKKWLYPALAFAFPVAAFLVLMMIGGYTPFGDYSMLYSDMYHQYFPFFKAFRAALLSGDSLLYNWDVGMGMDYLGLISYYLASPLNLLSVLVPESWLLPFFSLLVPIKLGLASLFFAIFLKRMFGRNDLSITLFGCFYGMCAWALGYQWNIMWLDTFALLPLVALGTVSLLRDKKFVLYTVTLALSILSNYYIGFFTCIFVLLLFICYQICRCRSLVRFFADLGRIALFSVLAIGMTAVLELPALAALQTTQSSVNSFPEGFSLNIVAWEACSKARDAWNLYKQAKEAGDPTFSLWFSAVFASFKPIFNGMRQVAGNMGGGIAPTFKEGLPNLYCGVGTIVLAFLFLTTPQIKRRDKFCTVGLLVFFMLSFIIRKLDYIWHGFHFTNMIPYRFSFLFSFVMLYMAYRAYLLRRRFQIWQITVAGLLAVALLLLSNSWQEPVFLAFNGVFLVLYLGILVYEHWDRPLPQNREEGVLREYSKARLIRRRNASLLLSGVMCIELVVNLVNFGVNFACTYIGNYPRGTSDAASMIKVMKELEDDTLFYRAEVTHTQTLNDGALNGYHGISTFTSSANVKVTEFMQAMGFSAKNTYNRYCFEESSPVANLFLNLKYMLERDGQVEENSYFDDIHHYGSVHLLKNNAYLPLGFLAESTLAALPFQSTGSSFYFQNSLFTAATGLQENVWDMVPGQHLTLEGIGVTVDAQSSSGFCTYKTEAGGTLVYRYEITSAGFLCMDLSMPSRNSFSLWKNGVELYSESLSLPQTLAVSEVLPGDIIELRASCGAGESSSMTIRAAILNDKVFRQGYDILNASTLELTAFSNTRISGVINANRDGLLYTSIPQNGGWTAMVDGAPAEIELVGSAMVAVHLTEGVHEVTFTYRSSSFTKGLAISLICLLAFAGLTFAVYYPPYKKRRGAQK